MSPARQRTVAPFGSWRSEITPESLVQGSVRFSDVSVARGRVYWVEARPAEGGRQVLVSVPLEGGSVEDVVPDGLSVRTQVHEYGGRCYVVDDKVVVFANWEDQRLWAITDPGKLQALTPIPEVSRGERYADPVLTPDGRWVVCVRESHSTTGEVVNDLVAVCLDVAAPPASPVLLASGHDFYAAPRFSPDGTQLAWITWNHPDMPWDSTQLWIAGFSSEGPALGNASVVAGGPGVSVTQPRFSPSGVLLYASDESGWWNIHDQTGTNLCVLDAEFAEPDWVFGNSLYCFQGDDAGRLVAVWASRGIHSIGYVEDGRATAVDFLYSQYASLTASGSTGTDVVAIASSPLLPPAVVRLDMSTGGATVLRSSQAVAPDPQETSVPVHVEFQTAGGETAHALLYEPRNAGVTGPKGSRPPLMVVVHGGPTSEASPVFNLRVQYWTNRGFAVADVDHRGSSGYGRAYRRLLDRAWGVVDVEDCAAVVSSLSDEGRVDGRRAVIRGGSAGGFTTLAALCRTDAFAAGASYYGIADLELLARDTHKFEARYTDGLIGPWPEDADEYKRRSPVYHVEEISSPLILFQGLDDKVVPPAQSQLMYEALRARGVPVAYLAFEGEQHGFRRAETLVAVMTAELEFYGRVLGFEPDGSGMAEGMSLEIANSAGINPPG